MSVTCKIDNSETLIGTINYGTRGPRGRDGGTIVYEAGNGITIQNNVIAVDVVDELSSSMKPITSNAVNITVGNINSILTTI